MRSHDDGTSTGVSVPPNAFDPAFLARVQGLDEPLTAAEAELAGPWKVEALPPVPGRPGASAVLRAWESVDKGDRPLAVFVHPETAALFAALLPSLEREPLYHLRAEPDPAAPLPGGGFYPLLTVYGEQGPVVGGWLDRYRPEAAAALHLLEALVRSPYQLAAVCRVAGGGALAQAGRTLAESVPE
jgi:hypothetical protein